MTTTDLTTTPHRTRRRMARTEPTPQSRRAAVLEQMLTDPAYAGWAAELGAARDELLAPATTALAA